MVIHQTLLLWLSGYQVVAVSFQSSEEIVYRLALVPSCRIYCSLFYQFCSVDCLFVFNLLMLNVKFAVCSISSAAHQNSSVIFWAYSVPDTIHCFSELLYTFIIAVNLLGDIKHIFIKFTEELYYLLKPLFILTASVRVL